MVILLTNYKANFNYKIEMNNFECPSKDLLNNVTTNGPSETKFS